jgi:hypothetical protein
MKADKFVAKCILDKYHRSKKYRDGINEGTLSIKMAENSEYMNKNEFQFRESVNRYVKEINKKGLIKVTWRDPDNIIENIRFDLCNIESFYEIAEVKKPDILLESTINVIKEYNARIEQEWIKNSLENLVEHISIKKELPASIRNKEKMNILLNSLLGVDELLKKDAVMLERVFSKKYLKDSKLFSREAKSTIIRIIRDNKPDINNDLENDDILKEVGIEKTSSDLLIKGAIKVKCNGKVLDCSILLHGTGVTSYDLQNIVIEEANVNRIISVENKANFLIECELAREDDIIVFSGGYYTPIQRKFLKLLKEYVDNNNIDVEYYHSGDFDFGGISIYKHIKTSLFHELKPYKMDLETFLKNIEYAETINEDRYKDTGKLEKMLKDETINEFHPLISRILMEGKVLEQESLLF